jgi:uncharacterized membrane protein YkvA (DUF1232 family)
MADLAWIVLRLLALVGGLVLLSWLVLGLVARRLPPGVLKDITGLVPACLTTARRLRRDPRVPRSAKVAVIAAALWVVSPIDLIPEFIPVIGPLDDVIVVALLLRFAARRVPRAALQEAWAGEPAMLDRLLGSRRPARCEPNRGG